MIDYSLTINKFTNLDAYPLPKIDEMTNQIAQYRVFSTTDLKSAYYQVPLREEDKKFTAFEANGCLLGMYRYSSIGIGIGGIGLFLWYQLVVLVSVNIADTCRYFLTTK